MDTSLHYLLMIVHSLFQKQVLGELSSLELTAGQPKILDYLGRHDGSVQKAIATGCQIDPATLTGLLNRMEQKGLIERKTKDGNRRSFHIYLTPLGWKRQEEVMSAFKKCEEKLLRDLSADRQEELIRTLSEFCGKMTDIEVLQ
ncbi:MarR family transcriptional regulator [Anaerovorax odorimutans]|uniref:MarR family transcriptional regulator n=1 Tax=Anaerovorax odorimutans TaxID=109327 RepID=A0ABT1RLZ2_9FIRM|nr:MarR family transcriptional regulator [Anaerovorax odorimutans]MCQ4636205.1 MarR family transcriptional regulator [Anaerovorax odorimutans]